MPKGINEWVARRLSGQHQGKPFGIHANVWNRVKPTSCDGVRVVVCTDAGSEVNDVCRKRTSELLGSSALIKPCSFLGGTADRLVSLCNVLYKYRGCGAPQRFVSMRINAATAFDQLSQRVRQAIVSTLELVLLPK